MCSDCECSMQVHDYEKSTSPHAHAHNSESAEHDAHRLGQQLPHSIAGAKSPMRIAFDSKCQPCRVVDRRLILRFPHSRQSP